MKTNRNGSNRGAVLVVALVMMVLISGLCVGYLTISTSALRVSDSTQESLQALYLAEAGMARAVHEINQKNWSSFVGPRDRDGRTVWFLERRCRFDERGTKFQVGAYSVQVEVVTGTDITDARRFRITSTGIRNFEYPRIGGGVDETAVQGGTGVRRAVQIMLSKEPESNTHAAIKSEGNLTLSGNMTVDGPVRTNGSMDINGIAWDVNTSTWHQVDELGNPVLDANGNPIVITFPDSMDAAGDISPGAGGITPQMTEHARPVEVPKVDINDILVNRLGFDPAVIGTLGSDAGGANPVSNNGAGWMAACQIFPPVDFTGDNDPSNDPPIYLINGDLTLASSEGIDGIFLVRGDVHVSGNITVGDPIPVANSTTTCPPSQLMLATEGCFDIGGNSAIYGTIMANLDVKLRGNCDIVGSVTAKNIYPVKPNGQPASIAGNVNLTYVPMDSRMETLILKWWVIGWCEAGPDWGSGFRGDPASSTYANWPEISMAKDDLYEQ